MTFMRLIIYISSIYLINNMVIYGVSNHEIRNTVAKNPIRGNTFIEVEKYINFKFLKMVHIDRNCLGLTCAAYNGGHLIKKEMYYNRSGEIRENYFDMHFQTVYVCYPPEGSSRLYEWVRADYDLFFGQHDGYNCSTGYRQLWKISSPYNKYATCPFCGFIATNTAKIDTTSQYADLEKNMIVTGVQLVRVNDTISIKIKQGKLLKATTVQHESDEWKELDSDALRIRQFNEVTNSMQLDDVIVPDGNIVGGVRFAWTDNRQGFRLEVLGTPYDVVTGKLDIWNSIWYNSDGDADIVRVSNDQITKRGEIQFTRGLKNPLRTQNFTAIENSNKFIRFNHTDLVDDAGQTVIPLLDAQPLITKSAVPLRGIGLFYYAAVEENFGGYIAPKLITY